MKTENRRRIEDQIRTIRAIADCDAGISSCCDIIAETLDDELEDLSDEFGANVLDGELVVDGPAPAAPDPSESSDQSALSDRPVSGLAAELRPFLKGRGNSDEREIVSAIFTKFHCKNVELAAIFGVRPNLIAKVKSGLSSPTVAVALKRFMEER